MRGRTLPLLVTTTSVPQMLHRYVGPLDEAVASFFGLPRGRPVAFFTVRAVLLTARFLVFLAILPALITYLLFRETFYKIIDDEVNVKT